MLVHLARGASNKETAAALHIEHTYPEIGASTLPAATLFAVQNGRLDPFDAREPTVPA